MFPSASIELVFFVKDVTTAPVGSVTCTSVASFLVTTVILAYFPLVTFVTPNLALKTASSFPVRTFLPARLYPILVSWLGLLSVISAAHLIFVRDIIS